MVSCCEGDLKCKAFMQHEWHVHQNSSTRCSCIGPKLNHTCIESIQDNQADAVAMPGRLCSPQTTLPTGTGAAATSLLGGKQRAKDLQRK